METETVEVKRPMPWKSLFCFSALLVTMGAYSGIHAAKASVEWWSKTKQELILSEVISELEKTPIEIDAKKKLPPEVTREQLLKMILVTHSRMSQCESNMQVIKDTVNFTEAGA